MHIPLKDKNSHRSQGKIDNELDSTSHLMSFSKTKKSVNSDAQINNTLLWNVNAKGSEISGDSYVKWPLRNKAQLG